MISLAMSPTNTRISPEPTDARPAGGGSSAASGGFSAVLAQHGPQETDAEAKPAPAPRTGETAATPEPETAHASIPSGTAMPQAAKTGKSLPVALPGAAAEGDEEATAEPSDEAAPPAAIEAILALAIGPQAMLPAPAQAQALAPEADAAAQTTATPRGNPALPEANLSQIPLPVAGEPKAKGEAANTASIALQVAPEPSTGMAGAAADARTDSNAPSARPRENAIKAAATQPTPADAARQADFANLATPALATPAPASASALSASGEARPSMQAAALQDLTSIVDRLAAAREVFAPATVALSIDHAEFGELSLRFDQRRDGFLSVQLSASNPDAHRAVAQAVGAQAFHSTADGQPESQSQTQSQAQSQTQGQSQMAGRGGADRDGNGSAARHEQPAPQQPRGERQAAPQPGRGDSRQPAGIFA